MPSYVLKSHVRIGDPPAGLFTAAEYADVERFYAAAPATTLHDLGGALVKDESSRLGLNAFKILGVKYALSRLKLDYGATVACATDGNHGRAVAHVAATKGLFARIYLPRQASAARRAAIESEGAEVVIVDGNYDDAVHQAAHDAQTHGWTIVSDTAWPGYEEIPRWIMAGYTRIAAEAARQWRDSPDIVIVQAGVGGLACAIGSWFAHQYGRWRPYMICAQAERSPCIIEAARVGSPARLAGSLETVMDCLSAGEVSHSAWPVIHSIFDAYVGVEDDRAQQAVDELQSNGIRAGYSGACGYAALDRLRNDERFSAVREASGWSERSRVLVIVSEGPL